MSKASDRAYLQIRAMILSGALAPGSQIREEQLAESCGVSRTPVRDALNRLESELLIRRSESQRSFVANWSIDDVEEAFILREMLEGLAARRAAERIGRDQLQQLQQLNAAIGRTVQTVHADIPAFLEHNRQFHGIILDASASPRLPAALAPLIEPPVVWRTAQNSAAEDLLRSDGEHDELLARLCPGGGQLGRGGDAGSYPSRLPCLC